MKYLIILLLLTMSCTDKKKESSTPETQGFSEETAIDSSTEDVSLPIEEKEDTNTKPLFASYKNGLDLIRIDTTITEKYLSQNLIKNYRTLYKEASSDQHYLATLEITNDILYVINPNYIEKSFNAQQHEPITYVGSLSPFQRLYVDGNDQLYLKTLSPFKDEYYVVETSHWPEGQKRPTYSYTTNKLTSPVIPYTIPEGGESYGITYYTNQEGMLFSRNFGYYVREGAFLIYLYTKK